MADFILNNQLSFLVIGAISFFLSAISLIIVAILWKKNLILQKNLNTLTLGKKGNSLEKTILDLIEEVASLDEDIQELFTISNKIYTLSNRGLHKVEMIRFNPFKELSGNQSFCLVLLDGNNNGIIISSLHTREGTRVYSKKIKNGDSAEHKLTEEEKQALKNALSQKVVVSKSSK